MNNNCKHCGYREINCHANCKSYKEFKEKLKKIKKNREEGYIFFDYLVDKRWKGRWWKEIG